MIEPVRSLGMKLAFVCENYFPTLGGIQEHVYHLRRQLESSERGHEPIETWVITGRIDDIPWQGPPDDLHVYRPSHAVALPASGSVTRATLSPSTYFRLRRFFAREHFDLLHVHGPADIGLPAYAMAAFDGPIVSTLHGYFRDSPVRRIVAPWYRHALGRCDAVIGVSEVARQTMARYVDFACDIIPNGIDGAYFGRGRRLPCFEDSLRNILTLGRIEARNGMDTVISGFGALAERRADVRLIVVGDGPMRAACVEQAKALPSSIARRIVFSGAVYAERADLYASADAFAMGARSGTFSIILLEALAAGLPIAAVPWDPSGSAGEHWSLTTMARDRSPAAFAEAIETALGARTPPFLARAQAMAQRYDWSEIAPRVEAIYRRVLGMPSRRSLGARVVG